MKIGIMLRHIQEKGGIVTYSQNLLKALIRHPGDNHYHLLYASDEMRGTYSENSNVSEHVIKGRGRFKWDHRLVPRLADELGLDIIFNPKLSIPLWAGQKRILVLRPEQFVHPELFPFLDRRYFKFFIPRFCKAAARVITPARRSTLDIIRYVGVKPENKVVTVHEGCGDHFFAPDPGPEVMDQVRQKYSLPERYVLFLGGLTPLKNFERLVEAFANVQKKHDIKLVVVGFKRWKFEKDLQFVSKHPVAKHIHFPGFVEDQDLPQVYRMAETLFFPSIYEGFGIPIAEALATGCPVITTTRGACPEVAHGAAVLVNPYEVKDMTSGLDRMLSDSSLRKELVAKGLKRAPHYRFDRVAEETLSVFESALAD